MPTSILNMPHRVEHPDELSSPTISANQAEVEAVRLAVVARDLLGVEVAFSEWLERDACNQLRKDIFVFGLADAIETNQPSILDYLLSQGVPYNTVHIKLAITKKAENSLQVFLTHGWCINEPQNYSTPLLLSEAIIDKQLTEWFLIRGANPNAECSLDYTPLSVAMVNASFSTIELLFSHGGSVEHGQLLFYAATRRKADRLEVLRFILSKGAPGMNSLLHQHRPNNFAMLKAFGLGTPLHAATEEGLLDSVQFLLNHGADRRVRNSRGRLARECAEYKNHSEIVEALSENHSGARLQAVS